MKKFDLEKLVGPIEWQREGKGFIQCPAEDLHTTPTKLKDTILYMDNVPTIFCLHNQCKAVVKEANVALRAALRGKAWHPKELTEEQKEARERRWDLERQARRLAKHKDWVHEKYEWPVEAIVSDSLPIADPWQQFLSIWPEDDIMWCGEPNYSGQFAHAEYFRPIKTWRSMPNPPHPFVCGTSFKAGTYSRTKDCIEDRRFLIVECDDLDPDPIKNKDMSGSVLKWLNNMDEWNLRCIVDSGNKSIHGWFNYPSAKEEEWARIVLPALCVDTATLRCTQPVRAAGIKRDNGNEQKLIWIR